MLGDLAHDPKRRRLLLRRDIAGLVKHVLDGIGTGGDFGLLRFRKRRSAIPRQSCRRTFKTLPDDL